LQNSFLGFVIGFGFHFSDFCLVVLIVHVAPSNWITFFNFRIFANKLESKFLEKIQKPQNVKNQVNSSDNKNKFIPNSKFSFSCQRSKCQTTFFWFKRKLNELFPRDFIGVAGWPSLDFEVLSSLEIYCCR
jgi:hypothetical protein